MDRGGGERTGRGDGRQMGEKGKDLHQVEWNLEMYFLFSGPVSSIFSSKTEQRSHACICLWVGLWGTMMHIPQRCCDLYCLKIREISERNDQSGVQEKELRNYHENWECLKVCIGIHNTFHGNLAIKGSIYKEVDGWVSFLKSRHWPGIILWGPRMHNPKILMFCYV